MTAADFRTLFSAVEDLPDEPPAASVRSPAVIRSRSAATCAVSLSSCQKT